MNVISSKQVALLIGPNAAVEVLPERAHHMLNTWDFYKPVGWKDGFPLMLDGSYSIDCYLECLDACIDICLHLEHTRFLVQERPAQLCGQQARRWSTGTSLLGLRRAGFLTNQI